MNLSKGHKIENLILVGGTNMRLRKKGMSSPVDYFFHGEFPDIQLFASLCYVYVMEWVPKESLFDPTEAQAYDRAVIEPILGTKA